MPKWLCRTIGCTSVFAKFFSWPYDRLCNPYAIRQYNKELAKGEVDG